MFSLALALLLPGLSRALEAVKVVVEKGPLGVSAPSVVIPDDEKSWEVRPNEKGESLFVDGKPVFVLPEDAWRGCYSFREVRRAEAARRLVMLLGCEQGEDRIFVVDPVTLRRSQVMTPDERVLNASYDLTPDGWYLVYVVTHSVKPAEPGTKKSDEGVFLYDLEKGEKHSYGPGDGRVRPRFSPDGEWLAFAVWDEASGRTSILVAGSDGMLLPALVSFKGRAARLAWDYEPQILRVFAPGASSLRKP
jgi:hypothetical protein